MLPFLYERVLKPALLRLDPERVHDAFVGMGDGLGRLGAGRAAVSAMYGYRGPDASVTVDGLRCQSPVVLAAGFDYKREARERAPPLKGRRPCAAPRPGRSSPGTGAARGGQGSLISGASGWGR